MVDAAARGGLDVLWSSGGNLLEVMPEPDAVAAALAAVPLRVHQDIVVSSQMLLEPDADGGEVLLLPVATRYEQEGGGTSTTTERRVAFSPELAPPPGEARSEWRLFAEVAALARPDLADRFAWPSNRDLRAEIARVVPAYEGIQHLERTGDAVQWGGRHLCADGRFPTASGRGRFSVVEVPRTDVPDGCFRLTTRRGKQFNTMLFAEVDPLTGAGRDAVYLDPADARGLGVGEGDRVRIRSSVGEMSATVHLARLPRRSAQVHWPEGNVLLPAGATHREPAAGIPDYQAVVTISPEGP
jgi:predicted molibdopterin-dependent oxidoreductase YjgC